MGKEEAVFGGGCFWCTEAIFKRLKGVLAVTSGYAGGNKEKPSYYDVAGGDTGHAEVIKVEFDPSIISYGDLLDVFWHTHNPTTLNQQDYDMGTEYRSVIFFMNENQQQIAQKMKNELEQSGEFKNPIVTEIVPFVHFYNAESYHQNYYEKNSEERYCQLIIAPKIQKLLDKYGDKVKTL